MATGTFFESFSERLAEGAHDLGSDTLRIYLSNATPSASADAVKADLAEISTGNGYSGPIDIENALDRTGAVTSVLAVDKTVTATGSVGPFRYVVLMNDDTTGDMLIMWWDYGSGVTLANEEEFVVDFDDEVMTIGPTV